MPSLAALTALRTPTLLLDEVKMMRNIHRLADHALAFNVILRPQMKTAKSIDVARRLSYAVPAPITVSTLAEAEIFHEAGYTDILYAVGIAPAKLDRVKALRARGCDLTVILDSAEQARAAVAAGVPALIEIDSDGHRGGLAPNDQALVEIGQILHSGRTLRGVITQGGKLYCQRGRGTCCFCRMRARSLCSCRRGLARGGASLSGGQCWFYPNGPRGS